MILQGDCMEILPTLPDKHYDMILCDLPYGTTENEWDSVLPLDKLWSQYKRIIKDNGCIALNAQLPFDKVLGASNLQMLRYEWVWCKSNPTGWLNANKMPMKGHELVLIFYKRLPTYNPQKTYGHKPVNYYKKHSSDGSNYGKTLIGTEGGGQTDRYPVDVLYFPRDKEHDNPTQKPVALCEYFIKTYTNEGEHVLDNCSGSGTTAIACINTNRRYTCIEKDEEQVIKSRKRIENHMPQLTLF